MDQYFLPMSKNRQGCPLSTLISALSCRLSQSNKARKRKRFAVLKGRNKTVFKANGVIAYRDIVGILKKKILEIKVNLVKFKDTRPIFKKQNKVLRKLYICMLAMKIKKIKI